MAKKSAIDLAIEKNLDKIQELLVVNDALRAVQDAKRKLRKPKMLTAVESMRGAS